MCEFHEAWNVAFFVVILLNVNNVVGGVMDELVQVNDDFLQEMYQVYKNSVGNALASSMRRIFHNNKEQNLHIQRLKEVNGFKRHNLAMPKPELRMENNPLIYISNPVESKLPNAFLSLNNFKQILTDRVVSALNPPNIHKYTTKHRVTHKTQLRNVKTTKHLDKFTHKMSPVAKNVHLIDEQKKPSKHQENNQPQIRSTDKIISPSTLATEILSIEKSEIGHKTESVDKLKIVDATIKTNTPDMVPTLTEETDAALDVTENIKEITTTDAVEKVVLNVTDADQDIKDEINNRKIITEETKKDVKEEINLRINNRETLDNSTIDNLNITDVTTQDSPYNVTPELVPDEEVDMLSSTTTDANKQKEINEDRSTIFGRSTASAETKSRRSTLGKPRVFMGR